MSLWNNLADSVFDGVGLAGLRAGTMCFFIYQSCSISFCHLLLFLSRLTFSGLVLWDFVSTDRVSSTLSRPFPIIMKIIIIIIIIIIIVAIHLLEVIRKLLAVLT